MACRLTGSLTSAHWKCVALAGPIRLNLKVAVRLCTLMMWRVIRVFGRRDGPVVGFVVVGVVVLGVVVAGVVVGGVVAV